MIVELQDKEAKETRLISTTIDTSNKPQIITGLRLKFIRLRIKFTLLKVIVKCYHNPLKYCLFLPG